MKMKTLLSVLALLAIGSVAFAINQNNTNATNGYNTWFDKDGTGDYYGAYPNASIVYDGTNLVLDVLHGGGKVSMPDGIDLGSASLSFGSSLIFEGSTADAFETTLTVVDPTADRTITLPNQTGATILSVGGVAESANAISGGTGSLVFEGTTADGFETSLSVVDPTADQLWSIPNFAVNAAFLGSTLTTNTIDAANSIWAVSNGLNFEGATADAFETTITVGDPSADRTVTVPNAGGTVLLGGNISVVSGANTACNTTCGASTRCFGGFDAGVPTIVDCADATADKCYCSAN